jgi:uncharacterized membrane protein YhaH (DUF805 family)
MSIWQAVAIVMRKYATFTGTAGRAEFWWWALASTFATIIVGMVIGWFVDPSDPYMHLWSLLLLLPSLAVVVRRLRDAGIGWGHVFWLLVPVAGVLVIGILCLQRSARLAYGAAAIPAV